MQQTNKIRIIIGGVALVVGSLIYLVDRPPDQTYFVFSSNIGISLHNSLPNLFGSVGKSLPAFVHVFSFILLTAGLVSCQQRGFLIICLSWFLVDSVFELGQKYHAWSSRTIPDWFTGIPFLENTRNYFLQGTFDFLDLVAITLGTVAAYFVLLLTTKSRRRVVPCQN